MPLQLEDGYPLLSSDEAFQLAWDCKFLGRPFPGYHVGAPLPDLHHAKQLVEAGHPDAAGLKQHLALGDEEYERAQSKQYRLSEVHASLGRGVAAGKITAFIRESAHAKFRIISSREWGTDERLRGLFRKEVRLGCHAEPFVPLLGFDEAMLRGWFHADPMPSPIAATEPRKRGAPVKLDYDWITATANRMKETKELRFYASFAALTRKLSKDHNHLKRDLNASTPDAIYRYLKRQSVVLRQDLGWNKSPD